MIIPNIYIYIYVYTHKNYMEKSKMFQTTVKPPTSFWGTGENYMGVSSPENSVDSDLFIAILLGIMMTNQRF